MESAIRVVLCDDDSAVRELTRYAFEEHSSLQVVGEAEDAEGGIRSRIREVSPETAIVVFSNFSFEPLGPAALEQGADGYVRKGPDFGELRRVVIDVCQNRGAPG